MDHVDVRDFGARGDARYFDIQSLAYYKDARYRHLATDSTESINRAIAHAVKTGKSQVVIPAGTYLIQTVGEKKTWDFEYSSRGGIRMKNDITLTLSPETTLVMNPTSIGGYAFISIDNKENITIRGGRIVGDSAHHFGEEHNYCYGVNIANASSNILIEGMDISFCEDDGLMISDYIEELCEGKHADSITIRNVNSHHNGRQGLSITSGSNILVEGNTFAYMTKHAPRSGIDIELECFDFLGVSNVTIINNTFIGNAFAAVIISDSYNDIPESLSHNIVIRGNTVEAVQVGLYAAGWVNGLEMSENSIRETVTEHILSAGLASASDYSTNVVIKNNSVSSDSTLKNFTMGILSMNESRNIITGNTLFGQDVGIVLSGKNALITGNTISKAQTHAIHVWDGTLSDHTVFGNTIIP